MSLKYTLVLPIQLTPPTPMTPASSASSTSQQMEKYKNARNKSPVGTATTDSSGKLRRYEGYEKDLHKILNKTSAKRTTAPLQPVKYALSYKK